MKGSRPIPKEGPVDGDEAWCPNCGYAMRVERKPADAEEPLIVYRYREVPAEPAVVYLAPPPREPANPPPPPKPRKRRKPRRRPKEPLTATELGIIQDVAAGLNAPQIARKRHLTVNEARSAVSRACRRTGVRSRKELAMLGLIYDAPNDE